MMDRPNARGVPFAAALESPSGGWDPHTVWRERVHAARRPPRALVSAAAITVLLDTSAGWDPLETWRLRVQRPRRSAR